MPFVLDNSVCCGWFLDNQASPYTEAIARRLEEDQAVVPPLWELELTNVLRTGCLKGLFDAQAAQQVLARILSLPIQPDRRPARAGEVLALALRFGLSSCDAVYLELALRLQLPIATTDGPLREAALASGVGLVPAD
ncbi:MAG TPA: type II toxin-antitoxin system VapC family toxin [Rubrivivax sp.]|nr:type II toxin-antitoxin system VapC family toxin [Rubrivivax sp.]